MQTINDNPSFSSWDSNEVHPLAVLFSPAVLTSWSTEGVLDRGGGILSEVEADFS